MRRIWVMLLALAIFPAIAFAQNAQVALGPAFFLKSPVFIGQVPDAVVLNTNQISLGADLRLRMGWFKAEGLALFSLGEVQSINIYLDAGLAFTFKLLTLSLGVGPDFTGNFNGPPPVQAGFNARFGIDYLLGMNSLGLSYITAFTIEDGINIGTKTGLLGVHLLFWL